MEVGWEVRGERRGGGGVDEPLMPRAVTPWLTALRAYSVWLVRWACSLCALRAMPAWHCHVCGGRLTDLHQLAAARSLASPFTWPAAAWAVGLPGRECCERERVSVRHGADLRGWSRWLSQVQIRGLFLIAILESALVCQAGCCREAAGRQAVARSSSLRAWANLPQPTRGRGAADSLGRLSTFQTDPQAKLTASG
jgi:hypothetical protein